MITLKSYLRMCKCWWNLQTYVALIILFYLSICFQDAYANSYLVSQEIRYDMPKASEVFLAWGINGWNIPPESMHPDGTQIREGVTLTPMAYEDGEFIVTLNILSGSTLEFGFLTTKLRDGTVVDLWERDGEQDYQLTVSKDDVMQVQSSLVLEEDGVLIKLFGFRFLLGMCLIFVFGSVSVFIVKRNALQLSSRSYSNGNQVIYLRDLLYELVARDFKLRYKRSMLGILWSMINPLAQLLVFHLIFSLVLPLDIPNYAAFLFVGLLVWTWFQSSLFNATGVIIDNSDLIRRPGFPVAILPVVTVITHFIHFILALPILVVFLMISSIPFSSSLIYLPLLMALQFILTLSLSYFVAALHVNFRDTQYLLGVVLLLGFYLSPIFYDINIIPQEYQLLYRLNPMVDLIVAYRTIFMDGQLPAFFSLILIGSLASIVLWIGYRSFTRASYHFVEEL